MSRLLLTFLLFIVAALPSGTQLYEEHVADSKTSPLGLQVVTAPPLAIELPDEEPAAAAHQQRTLAATVGTPEGSTHKAFSSRKHSAHRPRAPPPSLSYLS